MPLNVEGFGLSDPGCVRSNNEDAFLADDALELYVVADGMGGAQAGEHASRIAVQTVVDHCRAAETRTTEVLAAAFAEANRQVLQHANDDPHLYGMGTTLTAAWRDGDQLLLANVGDSRAYLLAGDEFRPVTDDQTWINEIGRKQLGIVESALATHPMRHVLTMAIGVNEHLRVQSSVVPLIPKMELLLCSDGLHGVVPSETIETAMRDKRSLPEKCHFLVDAARKAGGPDNVTVVAVRVAP